MLPLIAHCHLGLGKLYRRIGKRWQAHEHLTTATTMYREMDMRFWLEQAEGEMVVVGPKGRDSKQPSLTAPPALRRGWPPESAFAAMAWVGPR